MCGQPARRQENIHAVRIPKTSPLGVKNLCCNSIPTSNDGSDNRTVLGSFQMVLTGTISSLKRPVARAAAARLWLRAASSSCWARVMPYLSATFSEVTPAHQATGISNHKQAFNRAGSNNLHLPLPQAPHHSWILFYKQRKCTVWHLLLTSIAESEVGRASSCIR